MLEPMAQAEEIEEELEEEIEEVIEEEAVKTAEIPLYEEPSFEDMPTAIFDTATELEEPSYEDFPVTEDMPVTPPPARQETRDDFDASEFPFITDKRAERRDPTFGRRAERPASAERTVSRERVQSERPLPHHEDGMRHERATGEVRRVRDTLTTGELRLGRRMPQSAPHEYEASVASRKRGGKGAKIVVGIVIGVLAAALIAVSAILVVKEIKDRDERSPYASEAVGDYLNGALLGRTLEDARIVLDALAAANPDMPISYRVVYGNSETVPEGHVISYRILTQDGESIVELKISK